jgi:hypothetical protein
MPVTRILLLAGLLIAAVVIPTTIAAAQSEGCVEITQPHDDPPPGEVTVGVYCPGDDDSGAGDPPPGTPVGGGGGGGGGPSCTWEPSPFHEGEIRNGGESWGRYSYDCDDGTSGDTWLCMNCGGPEDDEPDWEAIQADLLLEATASLDLPGLRLRHLYDSPPDGQVLGVVRAETWWWTETAEPVTARAEDGPLWVEVTADPASLEVDPGDGAPVVSCPDGGTPYDFGRAYHDQEGGSDCVHVYQQTSAGQAGEAFTVTATLHWEVHWVSGGPISGAGTLPSDATTETFGLPVGELQSVVSR